MAFDRTTITQSYQPLDSDLTDIAALTEADSTIIVGTGSGWAAESGATMRTSLGVDAAGTDNSTVVTLTGTPNYITISGQVITRGSIDLADDVTGVMPVANGGTGATTLVGANIAVVTAADEWSAAQNFNSRSLTFDATQDWNLETDQVCDLTLTGNTTFDAPTNMKDGGFYSITIIQDGTGSRTVAWNSVFKWAAADTPVVTTTATTGKSIFVFRSDGTNMYEVGRQLDLR
jgi:hypothetical protein